MAPVKKALAFRSILASALIVLAINIIACEPAVRERPYGDLRLGNAKDLLAPESYLKDLRLLLRRDNRGWYVMSLMCTKDLSTLVPRHEEGRAFLASSYTTSTYDLNGKVLSGPAVADLPYYELILDEGSYGGPKDTLYARVGVAKSADWRLAVPESLHSKPVDSR